MKKKNIHKNGTIAAGHEATAAAGAAIFEQGGNAFDAALAAMLASCVAEPITTTAGGGGFMLTHDHQNRENSLFDFFAQTPRQKVLQSPQDFKAIDLWFGKTSQPFHVGMASAAVPGFFAGFFDIHKRLGTLPLSVIAQPAIDLARNGVVITENQHIIINMLAPIFSLSPEGHRTFYHDNKVAPIGWRLKMPQFADTIEFLVKEGKKGFYEGEIAQKIAKNCRENGGYLTLEDFKKFETIERKPLQYPYKQQTILTNPPPSSGGLLIGFGLKMLEDIDFSKIKLGSLQYIELLTKAMQLTSDTRKIALDDYLHDPQLIDKFLAPTFLQKYKGEMSQLHKRGCTTHLSVIDKLGNAASVTTSYGEGCGYFIPDTQIMLNNMLGEADLNPNGFHTWPTNSRLSSMMSPTIVLHPNERPSIVTGTGGANRIRTAILQVLNYLINMKVPVQEAVNAPRIHWEDGILNLEPNFEAEVYQATHLGQVNAFDHLHHFFGGAHTLVASEDGQTIEGAGDIRRAGAVA